MRNNTKIRILGISGSLKLSSSNSALTRALGGLMPDGVEYTVYNSLGLLPHFSPDIDGDNSPAVVTEFRKMLVASDGIIICTPEYAFNLPGVLKNALDWTVSTGEFYEKPTAVISASPLPTGGGKAHLSLMMTMTAMQASVPEKAKLMIASINKKMQGDVITDNNTGEELKTVINELVALIQSKQNLL